METQGLVDTGADITIIGGGKLFKGVAQGDKLSREKFRESDRTPFTYDNKQFKLHGVMDMVICFEGKELTSQPWNVLLAVCRISHKPTAEDQLLVYERFCRQLRVHPNVVTDFLTDKLSAKIPAVRVKLAESVHLLP